MTQRISVTLATLVLTSVILSACNQLYEFLPPPTEPFDQANDSMVVAAGASHKEVIAKQTADKLLQEGVTENDPDKIKLARELRAKDPKYWVYGEVLALMNGKELEARGYYFEAAFLYDDYAPAEAHFLEAALDVLPTLPDTEDGRAQRERLEAAYCEKFMHLQASQYSIKEFYSDEVGCSAVMSSSSRDLSPTTPKSTAWMA